MKKELYLFVFVSIITSFLTSILMSPAGADIDLSFEGTWRFVMIGMCAGAAALLGLRFIGADNAPDATGGAASAQDGGMLATVLDHAPVAVFLKDKDGRYLFANRSATATGAHGIPFIASDGKDLIGKKSADVFPPELADQVADHDAEVWATQQLVRKEINLTGENGEAVTFNVAKFPIFDADGTCVAIGGVRIDVSDVKNTEEQLRAAKEEAELSNRAKSEFIANMSHELRTPLNSIIGFSDLLVSQTFGEISPPQYLEYAGDINDAGKHLLQLINDLLDLARIERGQMTLNEQRLDICVMLQACVRLSRERALEAGVEIVLDCDRGFPAVLGDELRIKQAVVNLLSNGVKFSETGSKVTVAARLRDDCGVCLSVEDQGIGIAEKDIAVALAEFGQVDGSLTRRHEGTGLGLSLARKLVELHGGALELESEVGVGTTARLLFPATRTLEAPAADQASQS